jgi:hypothetical protein
LFFRWDSTTNELLLTNDGGLYKRTALKSNNIATGDWITLAGDLATSEIYSASYDYKTGQTREKGEGKYIYIYKCRNEA